MGPWIVALGSKAGMRLTGVTVMNDMHVGTIYGIIATSGIVLIVGGLVVVSFRRINHQTAAWRGAKS
jgi:hypothetical protein